MKFNQSISSMITTLTLLMKFIQSYAILFGVFLTFIIQLSSADTNICKDFYYTPKNGYRKPPYRENQEFAMNSVIRFGCYEHYQLVNISMKTKTCSWQFSDDPIWLPMELPICARVCDPPKPVKGVSYFPIKEFYFEKEEVKLECIYDSTMTFSTCLPSGKWSHEHSNFCYQGTMDCARPKNPTNGVVLCCNKAGSTKNSCCSYGKVAQFVCKQGYSLQGASQWKCNEAGIWLDAHTSSQAFIPSCVLDKQQISTPSPLSHGPLSSEMLNTLIGVAVGVLSLLLLVIILAFCKPKFKEIKRRWRDFREDDTRLVINGQEFHLPSYEEAISPDQELWIEPTVPSSAMLNLLSRPYINDSNNRCLQVNQQVETTTAVTDPPLSNTHNNPNVTVEEQPCCSHSSHVLTTSPFSNDTSSTSFNAFQSFCSSDQAIDESIEVDEDKVCDEDALLQQQIVLHSEKKSFNISTSQDLIQEEQTPEDHKFEDDFVETSTKVPCSPKDKLDQSNINFFNALTSDLQLEDRIASIDDNTRGGSDIQTSDSTHTNWTSF